MPAKPTIEQLREIAQTYSMHCTDADLESFSGLMGPALDSYRRIDQLTEPALAVRYPRTGGHRPAADENPLNAWYQKCSIKGCVGHLGHPFGKIGKLAETISQLPHCLPQEMHRQAM